MTIDYVVNQVETVVRKVGSRDPYVICNELDYKLHYASTRFSACGGAALAAIFHAAAVRSM